LVFKYTIKLGIIRKLTGPSWASTFCKKIV